VSNVHWHTLDYDINKAWWDLEDPLSNPQQAARYPSLRLLTPRELDLLSVFSRGVPEMPGRIVDLSQAIRRESRGSGVRASRDGVAPCVTPHWRPWHTGRGRFLTGRESFALQAIPLSSDATAALSSFPEHILHDLAGNAFHGACFLVALILSLAAPALAGAAAAQPQQGHPMPVATGDPLRSAPQALDVARPMNEERCRRTRLVDSLAAAALVDELSSDDSSDAT
jgi:hypothetical protein